MSELQNKWLFKTTTTYNLMFLYKATEKKNIPIKNFSGLHMKLWKKSTIISIPTCILHAESSVHFISLALYTDSGHKICKIHTQIPKELNGMLLIRL